MKIIIKHMKTYLRDLIQLLTEQKLKNRCKLLYVYHRLVLKNIIYTKLFNINTNQETVLGFKVNYDNFNSFFAMFTEIFIYNIYNFKTKTKRPLIVDGGGKYGLRVNIF